MPLAAVATLTAADCGKVSGLSPRPGWPLSTLAAGGGRLIGRPSSLLQPQGGRFYRNARRSILLAATRLRSSPDRSQGPRDTLSVPPDRHRTRTAQRPPHMGRPFCWNTRRPTLSD